MKKRVAVIFVALLLFVTNVTLFAQNQADANRREVYVVLDVSGSMNNENRFNNVQDYLEREVVDTLLQTGDDFNLIIFGEGAREQLARTINTNNDKTSLKADLRRLRPDDDYTDIGMALEKLAEILDKKETDTRRVIIFITDGLNAPPPGSKYYGANISLDDRFRTLGERISRGSWFFYVIGIGGITSAQEIADLVPGSQVKTTSSDLAGAEFAFLVNQQEDRERARAEEEQENRYAGFIGALRSLADSMGIPLWLFIAGFFLILLLLFLLILFFVNSAKPKQIIISDGRETLRLKIPFMGKVTLNSPSAILPSLGKENDRVFSIERGISGFKLIILKSEPIADNSIYKKVGTYPLKGAINLANGSQVWFRV